LGLGLDGFFLVLGAGFLVGFFAFAMGRGASLPRRVVCCVHDHTFVGMRNNRLWMVVALLAGCAQQSGSTQVQIAPVAQAGPSDFAEYELRASDGREVGRLIVANGMAVREAPGRHIVRAGVTVENRCDGPLALPASELYLTNLGPNPIRLTEVSEGIVPEMIVVAPGERKSFGLGFALRDYKVDDVKQLQLHWLVLLDGAPVGQQVTALNAIEKSRTYRDYSMRSAATMDDNSRQPSRNAVMRGGSMRSHRHVPMREMF
jgi:hypothetical protein